MTTQFVAFVQQVVHTNPSTVVSVVYLVAVGFLCFALRKPK